MKFGIFYEHQLPRPWADGDERRLFEDALKQVELADRLGIDYVWEVEHHFLEEYSHSSAPEVFLAACSQRTRRIRLGHGVTLMPPAYNHPARVAERIATLDLVSGGRVDWGTGESSSRIELEGFGVDPKAKRDMWTEALRETAKMMASDPYLGYAGDYFSMPHRNVVPKPVQKPHPPIWVACSNRETIKLAAKLGIGALTFAFVDGDEASRWVSEYYESFEADCEPIGLDVNPNVAMVTGFMCHEDRDTAVARGLRGFQFFGYALSHYYATGTHTPGRFDIWQDFLANGPKELGPTGCIGDPDQVRRTLLQYERAGGGFRSYSYSRAGATLTSIFANRSSFSRAKSCRSSPSANRSEKPTKRGGWRRRSKPPEAASPKSRRWSGVPQVESYPVLMEKLGAKSDDESSLNGASVLSLLGAEADGA